MARSRARLCSGRTRVGVEIADLISLMAERLDKYGKGGGLIDGELVREFPHCRNVTHRHAA